MTYYTYPEEKDFIVYQHGFPTLETVIKNELITRREMEKRGLLNYARFFKTVSLSCKCTFRNFGARFAMEG